MKWLALFLAVAFAFSSTPGWAGTSRKGAGSGAFERVVPGLAADGYGDESTLQWIYDLPSAQGISNLGPVYYFSNNVTGLAAGSDVQGCGTKSNPCRSIYRAGQLASSANYARLRFDAADTWDWNTAADISGPASTGTVTIDAAVGGTITHDSADWSTFGFHSAANHRVSLSGSGSGNDGIYVVSSISGAVMTIDESITPLTADEAAASITVTQLWDQINFNKHCDADTGDGTTLTPTGTICGVVEGSDMTGNTRPTFDCSNMPAGQFINGNSSALNGLIDHQPQASRGAILVQNLVFNDCPNTASTGGKVQDLVRGDGGGVITLNVECLNVLGLNNQCQTHHASGESIAINMSGSIGDSAQGSTFFHPASPGGHVFISNRSLLSNNNTTTATQGLIAFSDLVVDDRDSEAIVIGPTLSYPGGGSGTGGQVGVSITWGSTQTGESGTMEVDVAHTTFVDIDGTNCIHNAIACSAGISNQAQDDNKATTYTLRTFRNTFHDVGVTVLSNGFGAGETTDVYTHDRACDLADQLDQDASGNAWVATFFNDHTTGTFDANIRQQVWDDDDGTLSFAIQDGTGITDYATQALAVAGKASGWTNFYADPTTYESAGSGTAGNQFCTRVNSNCNAASEDLTFHSACSSDASMYGGAVGDSNSPQCFRACTVQRQIDMPSRAIPFTPAIFGAEIKGFKLNASRDANIGAR